MSAPEELATSFPGRATTHDPETCPGDCERLANDLLDRWGEQLAALSGRRQAANPGIKPTRIRRAGPVSIDPVDRLPAPEDSLAEDLSRQLRTISSPPRMLALADWIVWNLEPDGYLHEDLARLAAVADLDVAELEQALAIVQSLEPAGVGARSLRECLLLQLRAQAGADPVAVQLVDSHLEALAEKRYGDLARLLRQPLDRVMEALATIRRLEPVPGRAFGAAPAQTVRPDVAIEKHGDDYRVVLVDDDGPEVRVTRRRWAEAAADHGEARPYLTHRLRAASCVISARERRRNTLRGIAESIVRRQRECLDHGLGRLRPLSLRQVALDVGVHESTVSRAVADRYVETPLGVMPLRAFFTSHLPSDPAGLASPLSVRRRIREIIEAEDPIHPLADAEIAWALAAAGIRIARRTVMKYRSILGMARAPARRSATA